MYNRKKWMGRGKKWWTDKLHYYKTNWWNWQGDGRGRRISGLSAKLRKWSSFPCLLHQSHGILSALNVRHIVSHCMAFSVPTEAHVFPINSLHNILYFEIFYHFPLFKISPWTLYVCLHCGEDLGICFVLILTIIRTLKS